METNSTQQTCPGSDELYRRLPSVNELLLTAGMQQLIKAHGRERVVDAIRRALDDLRNRINAARLSGEALDLQLAAMPDEVAAVLQRGPQYSLRRVINATGVILHTNLGRAPLSEAAIAHIGEVARDYSNLEFDLETGERSRRDIHAERLVLRALNVPDEDCERYGVVIVNNCAAATFLALNALAEKREVVVSRGELVEIGGGFRIPEILENSGALLREVGTTNRTRISDYEHAVCEQTALLLRVHQSNFSIEGFVERPSLHDMVSLARTLGVPLFEDQGTGLLSSLDHLGITAQPTLRASVQAGVNLIAASGDKLLGGPQCGILIGRSDLIARIRKNPLLRTFRVDKLTYAALEATLHDYLAGTTDTIPLLSMLHTPAEKIEQRCHTIRSSLTSGSLRAEITEAGSVVGGGTAPNAVIKSYALSLRHSGFSPGELLKELRRCDPPIIARIADDRVLLDLRTVPAESDETLVQLLNQL
jgi:L-seryl-tRNA(Ser) seleniumtransferase